MSLDSSISRVKETFENWAMYEAVIRHNYMFHQELVAGLKTIAAKISGGLRIIDLGCGDAWLAAHAFCDANVESYLGIDLSESAIRRAQENTALGTGTHNWCVITLPTPSSRCPMRVPISFWRATRCIIFSRMAKPTIVHNCFRILRAGGIFCWIDPARRELENRADFLCRLTDVMQIEWIGLTQPQRDHATEHIWASDYPETEAWMWHQSETAGFQYRGRFLEDNLFGGWEFIKPG